MSTTIEPSSLTERKAAQKPAGMALRIQTYRWTYKKYERLVNKGFLSGQRVELVGGRIYDMAPQKDLHFAGVNLARMATEKCFGAGYWSRMQGPMHLDRWSGPEPDVAVVVGNVRDYVGTGHPKTALLIIEVSDTTLKYDRRKKGPRYARAGYGDYWIVNLVENCVEVYRKPVQDPSAPLGWRYAEVSVLQPPASVVPIAAGQPILVADLLPVWDGDAK